MNCRRRWLCGCAASRKNQGLGTHILPRATVLVVLAVFAGALTGSSVFAQTTSQGVYGEGLFELGDASLPFGYPGEADVLSSPDQPGPDWAELFTAEGKLRDEWPLDDAGFPLGNGIPDYVDRYGGKWAVFLDDDVSLGTDLETTALTADGRVENGAVEPQHDLGNAYLYATKDAVQNLVLFAGVERLDNGDSELEIEMNQVQVRLGHGGYGKGLPWQVLCSRTAGDLLLRLSFLSGELAGVTANVWNGEGWEAVESLPEESCNEPETLCAISNSIEIDGGPWPNRAPGDDPERIGPNRFFEVGVNAGVLIGAQLDYTSVQFRTPQDIAFGQLREGN